MDTVRFLDIQQAQQRIDDYIHRTPVLTSQTLNRLTGCELYFKCENFQKVGAFKFRGACNAVFALTDDAAQRGVATHSSGNHGAALALAARLRGIDAHVVIPENAPTCKKIALENYGANISYCAANLPAREALLAEVVEKTGATVIAPYDNPYIIAGQGTATLELLDTQNDLDIIITPVGGGGLLSGSAIAAHGINPDIQLIAAEPKEADDAYRSLQQGKRLPVVDENTICDGLRSSLGELNFHIIQQQVHNILLVDETQIYHALKLIWERMKIVVEPSAAIGLAMILQYPDVFSGKKVGVILSGGNVDFADLIPRIYT